MPDRNVRRAFNAFYFTLGLVVLLQSLRAAAAAGLRPAASPDWHVLALAGLETLGALLFLWRPLMRAGGAVLIATFAIAATAHGLRGEFPGVLLVYAAGTGLVMAHGFGSGGDRPSIVLQG